MKLVIFDVGNASCSLIVCPNGYAMMVDCGSHNEKDCPIDNIKRTNKEWLGISPFKTNNGNVYDLSLLHVTHPDDDHVRNAKSVKEKLPPYLVCNRKHEEFPLNENIHEEYKEHIDKKYRGNNPENIPWGFSLNRVFQISMKDIKGSEELSASLKNNSSILRLVEHAGIKILFGGDMEKDGWDWLIKNDKNFVNSIKDGVDILIAPHHGHKSGFPTSLFDLMGNVKISILSKGSESEKDGTDVSSQYSQYSDGIKYKNMNDGNIYFADGVLTTRSNGTIYFDISSDGVIEINAQKASSNHSKIN